MAFSAGLPTDFLAGIESSPDHARTPRNGSPTTETPAHSPFAPSFRSATTHSSSIFDDSASLSSSSANTPVTPAFSPLIPYFHNLEKSPRSPAYEGPESLAKLQDQFLKATKAWKVQQFDLESQIRALRNELDAVKGGGEGKTSSEAADASECRCDKCGCSGSRQASSASVLARPRPLQGVNSTGSLFGSGLTP